MRRVHPGFIQRATFMATNVHRIAELHRRLLELGVRRDMAAGQRFYDEYLAVMDLPAEFYLQTVKTVFQDHALPKGEMTWHGRKVEPRAIESTALVTIEAGRDDVSGRGQTDTRHMTFAEASQPRDASATSIPQRITSTSSPGQRGAIGFSLTSKTFFAPRPLEPICSFPLPCIDAGREAYYVP